MLLFPGLTVSSQSLPIVFRSGIYCDIHPSSVGLVPLLYWQYSSIMLYVLFLVLRTPLSCSIAYPSCVVLVHLFVFLVHSVFFLVYPVVVLVLPAVIMSRWRRNPLVSHTTTGVNIAADTAHPLATISATPADKQMPRSMVLQTTEPCSRWLTSKCHGVLYYRPQNFVLFGLNQTTLA